MCEATIKELSEHKKAGCHRAEETQRTSRTQKVDWNFKENMSTWRKDVVKGDKGTTEENKK